MLWTIFVILLVMWLLGMATSYTLGGFHPHPSDSCDRDRAHSRHSGPNTSLGPLTPGLEQSGGRRQFNEMYGGQT